MADSKKMAAAAKMMFDSSRHLDEFASRMEGLMDKQETVLDSILEKLEHLGKSSSKGKEDKAGGLKGIGGAFKDLGAGVKEIAAAIIPLSKGLALFAKAPGKHEFIWFMRDLYSIILKEKKIFKDKDGSIEKGYEDFSKGLGDIGDGMVKISWGIAAFWVVSKASKITLDFISSLSDKFVKIKAKKATEGADALSAMAKSIEAFGASLAISTLLFAIGAIGSLIIVPLIAGYSLMFYELGDKAIVKRIDAGAESMLLMGLGLLSFGLGLFAVKELAGGNWGDFAKGALIVALGATVFGFLFYEIGKPAFAERILEGSFAMIFVGLALASLALGIFAFQALDVNIVSVLVTSAAVLLIGLAMGIVGVFKTEIYEGSIAMMLSGLGLASLAFGVWTFQALGVTFGSVLIAGAAMLIVGLALGIAGAFAGFIALGALSFILSGVALWALAKGIMSFDKVEQEDIGVAAESVVGIGLAMAGAGFVSWLILPGAVAVIAAGYALSTISDGLKKFKDVKFEKEDSDKIYMVLSSLSTSFALAGGSKGIIDSGGLMGFLGIEGPNEIKRGIDSVMGAGKALMDIAKGLADFSKMTDGLNLNDADKDPNGIPARIGFVLGAVSKAFGDIGKKSTTSVGIFGKYFGATDNEVEEGVDAVKGMGKEITDLAEGVMGFANMTFTDPITGKKVLLTGTIDKDGNATGMLGTAVNNIAGVLTVVSNAFGLIGSKDQKAVGGIWGSIFGATDNATAVGVSAVKGMGKEITDLAAGVMGFANMTFTDPITGEKVTLTGTVDKDGKATGMLGTAVDNITAVLTAVSSVFGKIGAGKTGAGGDVSSGGILGIFGAKDNVVKLGVEAVKGIGAELKSIADSVVAFSTIADLATAQKNITNIIAAVPIAFAGVYTGVLSKLDMGKVKDSFTPILSMLSNIVETLSAVKDKKITEDDSDVLSNAITNIFSSIDAISKSGVNPVSAVSALGDATKYIQELAAVANPLDKLASAFERIAKNVDKFTTSFKKMDPGAVKTADMLIQSMVVFSKVDPDALATKGVRAKELLQFIIEKGAKIPETPATAPTPAPALKEAGHSAVPAAKPQPEKIQADAGSKMQQQTLQTISDSLDKLAGIMGRVESRLYETLKVQDVSK